MPVLLDSGLILQNFLIAPDKQHVFVLAHRAAEKPALLEYAHYPLLLEGRPTELLQLDAGGQLCMKVVLPIRDYTLSLSSWWTSEGQLALLLPAAIRIYDPRNLQILEEWPIYDTGNAYSKEQQQTMTGEELDDLYTRLIQKAFRRSESAYVQPNSVSGYPFLILDFKNHPTEAWEIDTRLQDERAYIAKFGQRLPLHNSEAPLITDHDEPAADDYMRDGNTHLRYIKREKLGEKAGGHFAEIRVFELSNGKAKTRFSISNRNNRSLYLHFANNQYLTTADGTVWILYEGQLYRLRLDGK